MVQHPREDEFQRLKARSEEIDMILAAKEIEGDVRRSCILKLVDKDGHMDFTKLEGKSDIDRTDVKRLVGEKVEVASLAVAR